MSHDLALSEAFGPEYTLLAHTEQRLVAADFAETVVEIRDHGQSGVSKAECAVEYRRRIGEGNLQSYADTLMAGARRRAVEEAR